MVLLPAPVHNYGNGIRMHPVSENKVVSLDERAKDEQKPVLEQLLQEGARKL